MKGAKQASRPFIIHSLVVTKLWKGTSSGECNEGREVVMMAEEKKGRKGIVGGRMRCADDVCDQNVGWRTIMWRGEGKMLGERLNNGK